MLGRVRCLTDDAQARTLGPYVKHVSRVGCLWQTFEISGGKVSIVGEPSFAIRIILTLHL